MPIFRIPNFIEEFSVLRALAGSVSIVRTLELSRGACLAKRA